MKLLRFPDETLFEEKPIIGILEFAWTAITRSPCDNLTKTEHKSTRKLKKSLKAITKWKDDDKDSRIGLEGPQLLYLDTDEYEVLKKLFDAGKFSALVSEVVDDLWTIIDSAEDFKPALAKDE